jgi:hypothetical protein
MKLNVESRSKVIDMYLKGYDSAEISQILKITHLEVAIEGVIQLLLEHGDPQRAINPQKFERERQSEITEEISRRGAHKKHSDNRCIEAYNLFLNGMHKEEIAKRLNVPLGSIANVISRGEALAGSDIPSLSEQMLKLHGNGWAVDMISHVLRVSHGTVDFAILGGPTIPPPLTDKKSRKLIKSTSKYVVEVLTESSSDEEYRAKGRFKKKIRDSDDKAAHVLELQRKGLTNNEISAQTGIPKGSIRYLLQKGEAMEQGNLNPALGQQHISKEPNSRNARIENDAYDSVEPVQKSKLRRYSKQEAIKVCSLN